MTTNDGDKDLATGGLDLIVKGLNDALGELRELGMVGMAEAGRGFGNIALSGVELGHAGLTTAFASFCDRWDWGVRSLVDEGNDLAEGVGLAAGTFHDTDEYQENSLKALVNSVIGNPHATEDQVSAMSWGEMASQSLQSDYSPESFQKALDNSEQAGKDALRSMLTSPTSGLGQAVNLVESALGASDEWIDDAFGPGPEARAAATEQQAEAAGGGGEN